MCEAAVYFIKDEEEELIIESVDCLKSEEGRIRLVNLFGEERIVRGRIKALSLVNHKILLEPL
jgi:predicted RNA-binding protein